MFAPFSGFVHEGAVLYIGYSFRERIAFELIDELREHFKGKIDDSYALIPNLERGSKIANLLIKKNINPLPLTFEEFMKILEKEPIKKPLLKRRPSGITLRVKKGDFIIPYRDYKEFGEYFKILIEQELQKEATDNGLSERERIEAFLKGQSESWEAFVNGWDFDRDIYSEIKIKVENELSKDRPEENDAILLLGGGGLGKSVLLKRLAYDLYKSGTPVIILNSYQNFFDYKLIDKFCDDVNESVSGAYKIAIILDDAAANIDNVKKILIYLKNHSKKAVIVCASRLNEWTYVQKQWGFGEITSRENTFIIEPKMDSEEIERLLKHLGKILNRDELLKDLNFWLAKALTDYEGDFFSIIYALVDPARRTLNEIIWDEYKKLPSLPTKRAYEYVCLFSQYDIPLKMEMIVNPLYKNFGYSYIEFANDIYETEAKSLIIGMENDFTGDVFYRAKNKIIAQKLSEKLFDPMNIEQTENMVERYIDVLSEVRALDKVETDIARTLLVRYLGPNGIDQGKLNKEHLVRLYDVILNNDIEDSTILHHYGILESDRGNFEKATYLMNEALAILKKRREMGFGFEPENYILNSLGVLYSKEALKYLLEDPDTALKLFDKSDFYFRLSKMKDVTSPHPYHSRAISLFKKGEYYETLEQMEDAYKNYSEALVVIEEAKESVPDYELEGILGLESSIYHIKLGNFERAKKKLQIFIENAPHVDAGYILMSRLIFSHSKRYTNQKRREHLIDAYSYVEQGLEISPRNHDLLKLKYYIFNRLEPNNLTKNFEILLERYKAFDGNCSELKLLFQLGAQSFELGKYIDSRTFFQELNEKSYQHPDTSGIKRVAQDSGQNDKIFKGYISKFISKKEAYVTSDEIGYPVRFVPIAQKRELHARQDVEFNVAFNYRGALAINLRPF